MMRKWLSIVSGLILVLIILGMGRKTNTLEIKVDFPTLKISKVGKYHRLSMQDIRNMAKPGEPLLPEKTVKEDLAFQTGIKERIDYLKPEETVVNERYRKSLVGVKLRGITLEQLTKYLYSIESSPHSLEVRRLHIVPKQGLLDVTFEASTLLPEEI